MRKPKLDGLRYKGEKMGVCLKCGYIGPDERFCRVCNAFHGIELTEKDVEYQKEHPEKTKLWKTNNEIQEIVQRWTNREYNRKFRHG